MNDYYGGEGAYRMDAHYDTDWGALQSIDFGGRIAEIQDKLVPIRFYESTDEANGTAIPATADPQLLEINPTGSAFGGSTPEISNYLVVNPSLLNNFKQIMTDMGLGGNSPGIDSAGVDTIHERDWAIYTKANLKFDLGVPIDGNVGLRLVDTRTM